MASRSGGCSVVILDSFSLFLVVFIFFQHSKIETISFSRPFSPPPLSYLALIF